MPSLKLSNPFRRVGDRPSLKERAASLKAAANGLRRKRAAANPDAALIMLGEMWIAANVAYHEAMAREDELSEASDIEPPPAVFVQDGDAALGIARFANPCANVTFWYSMAASNEPNLKGASPHVGILRRPQKREFCRAPVPSDNLPDDAHTVRFTRPWPEAQARADEICAAMDKWRADLAAAQFAVGLPEAAERTVETGGEVARIEDEITAATATTLAGLQLQAEIALSRIDDADAVVLAWSVVRGVRTVTA